MKQSRMEAIYARRREAEVSRKEKLAEACKFFDHWGKVNSHFEAWTDEKNCKQKEDGIKKELDFQKNKIQLEERKQKLSMLMQNETRMLEQELENYGKNRFKKAPISLLERVNENCKLIENERRRLELESKLLGKLRPESMNENILFNCKKENVALAKLNWLDKKIEEQIKAEKEKKEFEARQLQIEEETRKEQELLREQKCLIESEIKELKKLQEYHLKEIKDRDFEFDDLHKKEKNYKRILKILNEEISNIISRKSNYPCDSNKYCNIKRVKSTLKQFSNNSKDDLNEDINVLQRVKKIINEDEIANQLDKLRIQQHHELEKHEEIERMYESEAKQNIFKWQETWCEQMKLREQIILKILNKQQNIFEYKIMENLKQQSDLVKMREKHLEVIENSNEKLKLLFETRKSLESKDVDICSESVVEIPSSTSINSSSSCGPKFGRKKIAWT